jgi:hypothetical protein
MNEWIQIVHTAASNKEVKHNIANCVKCGNSDIKIDEYDDQYGYISTASCKKCKSKVKDNVGAVTIIKQWNKQNDISTLIKDKTALIVTLKNEIVLLKKKNKERSKKTK